MRHFVLQWRPDGDTRHTDLLRERKADRIVAVVALVEPFLQTYLGQMVNFGKFVACLRFLLDRILRVHSFWCRIVDPSAKRSEHLRSITQKPKYRKCARRWTDTSRHL